MAILARLLRKQNLDALVSRTVNLLGPGWRVLVLEEDRVVLPAAEAGWRPIWPRPRPWPPLCAWTRARWDGPCSCHRPIGAPNLPGSPGRCWSSSPRRWEEVLTRENIRRVLAAETLQKYRELSLLHRATLS
jgi:hypothetical protein